MAKAPLGAVPTIIGREQNGGPAEGAHKGRPYARSICVGAALVAALPRQAALPGIGADFKPGMGRR
jgi:hypothetical protein